MIEQGQVCTYSEFLSSERAPALVFSFTPSLAALCLAEEHRLGVQLTEVQFEELKSQAGGLALTLRQREDFWHTEGPDTRDYPDYLALSYDLKIAMQSV